MSKYGFIFEDQENGMSVPVIIEVVAGSFEEACIKGHDLLLLADRVAKEGCSVIGEEYTKAENRMSGEFNEKFFDNQKEALC